MGENTPTKRRGRPATISRDEIVEAALALARNEGLERLSIRELARYMERPPMSLYAHIDSKEDLLIALLEAVLAELKPKRSARDPKAALKKYLHGLRQALHALPGLSRAMVIDGRMTPPMLGVTGTLLELLSALDLSLSKRVNYCRALLWVVVGFTVSEEGTPGLRDRDADFFAAIDRVAPGPRQHLHEALPLLITPKPDKAFDLAVELLVEGIWSSAS